MAIQARLDEAKSVVNSAQMAVFSAMNMLGALKSQIADLKTKRQEMDPEEFKRLITELRQERHTCGLGLARANRTLAAAHKDARRIACRDSALG